jgi:peptidoglycan/LPS O-acetylase OafA/YrhL
MRIQRDEITGLRAIAVLAVIFFHADFAHFGGGFVGVDVFFVISGYLITSKILRELGEHRFSLWGFYVGRLPRLYPALLAINTLTFGLGVLVLTPDHLIDLTQSALASTFWVSNLFFWSTTGYWDIESSLKPLLPTWSLAVEEQFYFAWPAILIGLTALGRRWLLWCGLAALGCSSLFAAEHSLSFDPAAAFYLTPFRVYEFAIGAFALLMERWKSRGAWLLEGVALGGIGLVLYPVFTFSDSTPFPGANAVGVAVGTAALIYAGSAPWVPSILRSRIAVWIGLRGYSLYLVHWPLFTLYRYWRLERIETWETWALILVTFVLADLLYRKIEERYRYPPPEAHRRHDAMFAAAILGFALVLNAPAAVAWLQHGWTGRIAGRPDPEITAKIEANLGLCQNGADVVLVGDSHAGAWTPAVAQALQVADLSGTRYPLVNNCKLLRDAYFGYSLQESPGNACRAGIQAWFDQLERDDPEWVVMASFWPAGVGEKYPSGRILGDHMDHQPTMEESRAYFEEQLELTIDELIGDGRKLIIIGSSPLLTEDPNVCLSRPALFVPRDCDAHNQVAEPATHRYLQSVFRNASARNPSVFYFDTFAALCPEGVCRVSDHDVSLFRDKHHLSAYGALWLQHHHFEQLEAFLRGSG